MGGRGRRRSEQEGRRGEGGQYDLFEKGVNPGKEGIPRLQAHGADEPRWHQLRVLDLLFPRALVVGFTPLPLIFPRPYVPYRPSTFYALAPRFGRCVLVTSPHRLVTRVQSSRTPVAIPAPTLADATSHSDFITDRDAPCLSHTSASSRLSLDKPEFERSKNDWFENEIITKTYYYREEPNYTWATSCTLRLKGARSSGRTISTSRRIIPRAVDFFTGKAHDYEDFDGHEGGTNGDLDEDDDEDSE
ncbi:hypothetical protein EXIGLDRAFT_148891 [Exidia glandulosa HHB12029]|uniref:Uncharacterized protein n=1 Tax=Exidia glandulosa HHB12029 TaxID=1314781 RepID=A0A166A7P4_EXIGL|nr:hypothetical protein EXIGLDRAFT_148891 [Exidia glandulosa HHB12029]